jgi:hypothetical protein
MAVMRPDAILVWHHADTFILEKILFFSYSLPNIFPNTRLKKAVAATQVPLPVLAEQERIIAEEERHRGTERDGHRQP